MGVNGKRRESRRSLTVCIRYPKIGVIKEKHGNKENRGKHKKRGGEVKPKASIEGDFELTGRKRREKAGKYSRRPGGKSGQRSF